MILVETVTENSSTDLQYNSEKFVGKWYFVKLLSPRFLTVKSSCMRMEVAKGENNTFNIDSRTGHRLYYTADTWTAIIVNSNIQRISGSVYREPKYFNMLDYQNDNEMVLESYGGLFYGLISRSSTEISPELDEKYKKIAAEKNLDYATIIHTGCE